VDGCSAFWILLFELLSTIINLQWIFTRNSRLCKEDITIGGMKIPKGMHIDIPIYGMTRDPEIWDDPLEFKPERLVCII